MGTPATATVRATLGGLIRDALTRNDAFSGVPRAGLKAVASGLETAALQGLLHDFQAEHGRFLAAFEAYERRIAELPEADRQRKPGVECALSLAAVWATPAACRRFVAGNALAVGGAIAARVHACLTELEARYIANPEARLAEQRRLLDEATKADVERVEFQRKLDEARKHYNLAGSLARVQLEKEVLALVAKVEAAAKRRDEALGQAREFSAVL